MRNEEELIQSMWQSYEQGLTSREVAAKFGVTPSYAYRRLSRVGLLREPGLQPKVDVDQIVKRYIAGDRVEVLASDFGLSKSRIYKMMKGVERKRPERPITTPIVSENVAKRNEIICEKYLAGESAARLAFEYNLSEAHIYNVLRDVPKVRREPKKEQEIIRRYKSGNTIKGIAKDMGLGYGSVQRALAKHGVKRGDK